MRSGLTAINFVASGGFGDSNWNLTPIAQQKFVLQVLESVLQQAR